MAYSQYGLVAATDYNYLISAYLIPIGPDWVVSPNPFNSIWAAGNQNKGYGQGVSLTNVAAGSTVSAASWADLVNKVAIMAEHQGTAITAITSPATTNPVTYLPALTDNLALVYANRMNVAAQGSSVPNTASSNLTWSDYLTFTHTVTFNPVITGWGTISGADAARYFFNSGGQLALTFSHATATAGINLLLNNLAIAAGTIVLSSPTSGTMSIAGTPFTGVTKVGGSGTATVNTNAGYYALNNSETTLFNQYASTGPAGYLGTRLVITARTNGTQGLNGDTGSVITITSTFDEMPGGLIPATGTTTTLSIRPPATITGFTNVWGTPTVSSVIAGAQGGEVIAP
jgi:hypothetical protein